MRGFLKDNNIYKGVFSVWYMGMHGGTNGGCMRESVLVEVDWIGSRIQEKVGRGLTPAVAPSRYVLHGMDKHIMRTDGFELHAGSERGDYSRIYVGEDN